LVCFLCNLISVLIIYRCNCHQIHHPSTMQRPRPTEFKTDFARTAALPTASLFQRAQANPQLDVDSETFLANIEEEWNKKVDTEVETLVDGMVDLVAIASIIRTDIRLHRKHTKPSVGQNRWYWQHLRSSRSLTLSSSSSFSWTSEKLHTDGKKS